MPLTLDKTQCWFGFHTADNVVHVYHVAHALCDSHDGATALSVTDQRERHVCGRCLALLNQATHRAQGAHYGSI